MKKVIILLLALMLTFSLCSCKYGIPEGEPLHPENYTFPEGVDD